MARDGRRWANSKHLTWLHATLPFYLAAVPNNTLNKYLRPTYEQWFIDFPEPQAKLEDYRELKDVESDVESENEPESENDERAAAMSLKRKGTSASVSRKKRLKTSANTISVILTDEEKIIVQHGRNVEKRKKQVLSWLRRKASPPQTRAKKVQVPSSTSSAKKSSCGPQPTEIYSKMHYEERVKPLVRERLDVIKEAAKAEGSTISHKDVLEVVKSTTRYVYDDESDAVKADVATLIKEAEEVRMSDIQDQNTHARTPQQYQNGINESIPYLSEVLREVHERTGWSLSLLMGGPTPDNHGKIVSTNLHVGNNAIGNTFGGSFGDFETQIVKPFQMFLRTVYPAAMREARSLHPLLTQPLLSGLETMSTELEREQTLPPPVPSVPLLDNLLLLSPGIEVSAATTATPITPAASPGTIAAPTTSSVVGVAAFNGSLQTMPLTPRLTRVSQGGLFTSPSTWVNHLLDDQHDTLPVPPFTSPEPADPIAEIIPKAKKAKAKKGHTAKKAKLPVPAAPVPAAPVADKPRRPRPAHKIHMEAPGTPSALSTGQDLSGAREGRVRKLTEAGTLLAEKKIIDAAVAAKAKATREERKSVVKRTGVSSRSKK